MTEQHDVFRFGDLEEGTATRVVIGTQAIALVLTQGELYAVDDNCSHGNVSLSEGEVDGCFLECWLHGSQFDLRTGEPTSLPANLPIATFPVTLNGTGPDARVLISL